MTVEDVILQHDKRGVTALRPHLPPDFCRRAAHLLAEHAGLVLITTGFYILRSGTPETDGPTGAVVIGISKDSVASHDKFKKKHGLPFILASDAGSDVCEKYGVWVEKSMYGRKYLGIERATFLIDGAGIVRGVWHKVRVPGHVGEVLKAVRAL